VSRAGRTLPGVFVTGTDTGIGKTLVATALVHALTAVGQRVAPFKPVAAGADPTPAGRRNEDAVLLAELAESTAAYGDVNPVLAEAPMAPHIALAREGRRFDRDAVLAAFARLTSQADVAVAEGAGGWLVPLTERYDMASLAGDLGLPVLIVVGLRLGCLSHARLTLEAVERRGLPVAGWVANRVDPAMAAADENLATLESALGSAPLAVLPWLEGNTARERAVAASRQGRMELLTRLLLNN
jgi:dethiobiotin synthetase